MEATAEATNPIASIPVNAVTKAVGRRKARWGKKRRLHAARRQPAPSASTDGMLEEISGAAPVPIHALPLKRAAVWVSRTRSHCSSSPGDRMARPVREERSTSTCWATSDASWRSCTN
ncbi:MAG: hypothetical protein ACRENX_10590 [Candidatus Dormibacteria bacterium]